MLAGRDRARPVIGGTMHGGKCKGARINRRIKPGQKKKTLRLDACKSKKKKDMNYSSGEWRTNWTRKKGENIEESDTGGCSVGCAGNPKMLSGHSGKSRLAAFTLA